MEKNMTEGSIIKIILSFSIPLILGAMLQQMYHMVDIVIAGNFIGEYAITAIGCTTSASVVIVNALNGLTTGISIYAANLYGVNNRRELQAVSGSFCLSVGAIGIAIAAAGFLSCRFLLGILNTPEDVFAYSVSYLRIISWGIPFQAMYSLLSAILRGIGDSQSSLSAIIVAFISNIIFDLVLIQGAALGVTGAALATIAAQLLSCLYLVWIIQKRHPVLHFSLRDGADRSVLAKGFRLGMPAALQRCVMSSGSLIAQKALNSFGSLAVAGLTTAYKIDELAMLPVINIGAALTTFIAQNRSAGKEARMREGFFTGIILALSVSVGIVSLMMCCFQQMIGFFGVSKEVSDYAYSFLRTCALFYPLFALENAMMGLLQGCGCIKTTVYGNAAGLIVRVLFLYLFYQTLGFRTIAYSEIICWIVASLIFFVCILGFGLLKQEKKEGK